MNAVNSIEVDNLKRVFTRRAPRKLPCNAAMHLVAKGTIPPVVATTIAAVAATTSLGLPWP